MCVKIGFERGSVLVKPKKSRIFLCFGRNNTEQRPHGQAHRSVCHFRQQFNRWCSGVSAQDLSPIQLGRWSAPNSYTKEDLKKCLKSKDTTMSLPTQRLVPLLEYKYYDGY